MADTAFAVELRPIEVAVTPPVRIVERPVEVSVVLPCLNEEESVGLCVTEALQAMAAAGWRGEVVVVDNGCTDRSAEVAAAAGAVVVREDVPGYGAALLGGIRHARGEVIVMADADCTYPLDRLAELVRPVRDGEAELMIASRLDEATRRSMPLLHRFVGTPILTWLVREGTGADGLSDSQSGFRAFHRSAVGRMGLQATGMEFASEMLIRAAQQDLAVRELPLGYRERVGESKLSTWRDGLRHLRLILRLSPHLFLWWPGLAAMVLGMAIFLASLVGATGAPVGSLTWQPVFFGTILVVAGLISAMSGAVLARYSPTASRRTRTDFAWVSDRSVVRRLQRLGLAAAFLGLALDGVLFGFWVAGSPFDAAAKLHLASAAQGLLLCGLLLAAALSVYRLLLSGHLSQDRPVAADS